MQTIYYRDGYKYQLDQEAVYQTSFLPASPIVTSFITLSTTGLLTIAPGYAWDGASGTPYNDDIFVYCSLPHDALYQLMREGHLDHNAWKEADQVLKEAAKERLLTAKWAIRMSWKVLLPGVMLALVLAKGKYADPSAQKKVREA